MYQVANGYHRLAGNIANMQILENRPQWETEFQSGWLAHYNATGQTDWSIYNKPNNKVAPAGDPIDLASSRLILISTAGGYLPASQPPFDAENDLGDYAIRSVPSHTPLDQIAYSHTHYDHTAVNADPQVLVPLRHLQKMVEDGKIGALTNNMIFAMGYQPDISQVLDETIPAILDVVEMEQADGALLVPS